MGIVAYFEAIHGMKIKDRIHPWNLGFKVQSSFYNAKQTIQLQNTRKVIIKWPFHVRKKSCVYAFLKYIQKSKIIYKAINKSTNKSYNISKSKIWQLKV